MKTSFLFASLLSLCGSSASASEWNNFFAASEQAEYFFDAESVMKTKDDVTLWVKTVQKSKPNSDGSWSSALNWRMKCGNRTVQTLSSSTYDSDGKFIRSSSIGGTEQSVIPDSMASAILKAVCMADFPKNTPATQGVYFKIAGNDVFAATKRFVEAEKSGIDSAPK